MWSISQPMPLTAVSPYFPRSIQAPHASFRNWRASTPETTVPFLQTASIMASSKELPDRAVLARRWIENITTSPIANIFVIANISEKRKALFTNLFASVMLALTSLIGGGMATVGERIKEVREARDWTQEKLAKEAGISKSFLSEVENQGKNIGLEVLLNIAHALGASLEYLATGQGEEPIVRKSIEIPVELSRAAEELHLTHKETLDLLEAYNSVVARRSAKSKGVVSIEDWKSLHKALKTVLKKTYG